LHIDLEPIYRVVCHYIAPFIAGSGGSIPACSIKRHEVETVSAFLDLTVVSKIGRRIGAKSGGQLMKAFTEYLSRRLTPYPTLTGLLLSATTSDVQTPMHPARIMCE